VKKKNGVPTHATTDREMVDKKRKEKEGVTRYPCNVTGRTLGGSFLKATQTPPSVGLCPSSELVEYACLWSRPDDSLTGHRHEKGIRFRTRRDGC
jgi:hypothetical protein